MTSQSYRAKIKISPKGPGARRISFSIYSALKPDLTSLSDSRATAEVSLADNGLIIDVESDDLPNLRASINSYLRLADASYRCAAG